MNTSSNAYRQQVSEFRARLNKFVGQQHRGQDRALIDTTGNRSGAVPSRSEVERFTLYGRRRYFSVARVMALLQILRDREGLATRSRPVEVTPVGAYWQAFRGTTDMPACHTCPALLFLDGNLPTLMTSNNGLRRYLIVEFADCMLMPDFINKIDRLLDDSSAWKAFANAASGLINNPKRSWEDALYAYREGMRQMFPEMIDIIERDLQFADPEKNRQFDAMKGFYEGLYLTAINRQEMNNFISAVTMEIGI